MSVDTGAPLSVSITVGRIAPRAVVAAILDTVVIVDPSFEVVSRHAGPAASTASGQVITIFVFAESASVAGSRCLIEDHRVVTAAFALQPHRVCIGVHLEAGVRLLNRVSLLESIA